MKNEHIIVLQQIVVHDLLIKLRMNSASASTINTHTHFVTCSKHVICSMRRKRKVSKNGLRPH